ncbi:MAG: hypothetical protein KDK70_14580 [Myxococcales bacterium]|nr:hypothetical protein [Myxococcales bacterium]
MKAGAALLAAACGGCGAMTSVEHGTTGKAVIGGLLAFFGTMAASALIIAITAAVRARRQSLLWLAIGSWGVLIVHLVGMVLVVESGPVASGLLPWYLQVAVATSVVPVAGAASTTSLALLQVSERPRRWVTPLVVLIVLAVHTGLMVAFLLARDPFEALSSTPVVEVRVGSEHGCARHEDGSVMCWGRNAEGQLGDGTQQDVDWPVMVQGLSDAMSLAVGDGRSCARTAGWQVVCWGRGRDGAAGSASPVPIAGTILAGPWIAGQRVFAVDGGGMVVSGYDSLEPLVPLPPVIGVAAGLRHVCVLLGDGNVSCWGDGQRGQLGEAVRFERSVPTAEDDASRLELENRTFVGVSEVAELVAGDHQTCGRRNDGTVVCWGVRYESESECRDGCSSPGVEEVVGLTDVVAITAGANHNCVLLETGEVACWGDNRWGQLGIGGYRTQSEPQTVLLPGPAVAVFANGYTTCAVLESGDVQCWGASRSGSLGVEALETCRARKALAANECATRPQPLRWLRRETGQQTGEQTAEPAP